MSDSLSPDDGETHAPLPQSDGRDQGRLQPDYYDKLISHYVSTWLVSGDGTRSTPYGELPLEFWIEHVHRLIDAELLVPSDLAQDLTALTNAQLKELCTSYGLLKSGKKAQLVDRLIDNADVDDLRTMCPGPFWVPAEAFQQILDNDMDYVWYLHHSRFPWLDPVAFDEQATGMATAQWHDLLWSHMEAAKLEAAKQHDRHIIRSITLAQAGLLGDEGREMDQFRALLQVCAGDLTDVDYSIATETAAMLIGDVPHRQLAPGLIEMMRRLIDSREEFNVEVVAGLELWDARRSPFTTAEMAGLIVDATFGEDHSATREIYRQSGERNRQLLYSLDEEDWEDVVWLCEMTIEMDSAYQKGAQDRPRTLAEAADPPEQRQQALDALRADVAAHHQR